MVRYTVEIETWGEGVDSIAPDSVDDFRDMLESLGGLGAVAHVGGVAGGLGATFGVESDELEGEPLTYAEVVSQALDRFRSACLKASLPWTGIAHVEVDSEAYLERDLEREPERYMGVSELVSWLDVSRQRISELRERPGFPAPVAEIAAGPVWTESSLERFVETWDRKPGRPRLVRDGSG